MGSMIYLAVQKHQSASGFALPQKSIPALTKPQGTQSAKGQTKQAVGRRVARALLAQLARW